MTHRPRVHRGSASPTVGNALLLAKLALVAALVALTLALGTIILVLAGPLPVVRPITREPLIEQPTANTPSVQDQDSTTLPDPVTTAAPTEPPPESSAPYRAALGRSPIPEPAEGTPTALPARQLGPDPFAIPTDRCGTVAWNQATKHVGQIITVQGVVRATRNLGHICFLNFVRQWRGEFAVVIYEEAFNGLPARPERYFLNKTIRVTGRVQLHKGQRPQIVVREADQIKVIP